MKLLIGGLLLLHGCVALQIGDCMNSGSTHATPTDWIRSMNYSPGEILSSLVFDQYGNKQMRKGKFANGYYFMLFEENPYFVWPSTTSADTDRSARGVLSTLLGRMNIVAPPSPAHYSSACYLRGERWLLLFVIKDAAHASNLSIIRRSLKTRIKLYRALIAYLKAIFSARPVPPASTAKFTFSIFNIMDVYGRGKDISNIFVASFQTLVMVVNEEAMNKQSALSVIIIMNHLEKERFMGASRALNGSQETNTPYTRVIALLDRAMNNPPTVSLDGLDSIVNELEALMNSASKTDTMKHAMKHLSRREFNNAFPGVSGIHMYNQISSQNHRQRASSSSDEGN